MAIPRGCHAVTTKAHAAEAPAAEVPAAEASAACYAAACIELYSRLWWELEQLTRSVFPGDESSLAHRDAKLVLLRLETIVLIDACDSPQLQALLGAAQREDLRSTLESLLVAFEDGSLEPVQNQLLDAVLALLARPVGSGAAPSPGAAPWRLSDPRASLQSCAGVPFERSQVAAPRRVPVGGSNPHRPELRTRALPANNGDA
jgi:hypothetical protein